MEAAKKAALLAVERASKKMGVEVAVLAFEGDCNQPVPRYATFTNDFDALQRFIASLQPGGGTPMAPALLFANRFMRNNGASAARDQMIVLLADGQNDCGSVTNALAELQADGIIFRHETIGFGIEPDSAAAQDLRDIATARGGAYHHAANSTQLGDLFMQFVDTFTLIDMLGMFGGGTRVQPAASSSNSADSQSQSDADGLTGMLGSFKSQSSGLSDADTEDTPKSAYFGALAIDSNQGPSWGWSIDYPSFQDAVKRALDECSSDGSTCRVVLTFSNECAAYAADQSQGSTATGWAKGYTTSGAARNRALTECRQKGGTSCIVRSWGCTRRD